MTTARVSGTFSGKTWIETLARIVPMRPDYDLERLKRATYREEDGRIYRAAPYLGGDAPSKGMRYDSTPFPMADWNRVRRSDWRNILRNSSAQLPTHDTLLKELVKTEHGNLAGDGAPWEPGTVNDDLHRAADELAEQSVPVDGHGSVIAPEGRAYAALIHLHDRRGEAGFPMRESRAQNTDGAVVSIRTRSALTQYITGLSLSRDALHSAANEVQGDVTGHLADMVKSSKTAAQREKAYWAILDIDNDMRGAVKAKAQTLALSTDAPTDAALAREFHIERVETTGAEQRKAVMGAVTQQGMWEEGGCTAMSRTLQRIAEEVQAGVRAVWRATPSTTAMKTAADTAITTITGLTESGGGPSWYEDGGRAKITSGLSKSFTFDADATAPQSFAAVVSHPPSAEARESETAITGIEIVQEGFSVALDVPTGTANAKRHRATITYSGDAAPTVGLAVRLTARNACGPSVLEVSVAAPTPSE